VIDPKLLDYCQTDRQREILELLLEKKSKREVARHLDVSPCRVRQALYAVEAHAAKKGYSPEHGIARPLPEHLMLTGASALVDERTGQTVLQWYKSGVDRYQMQQMVVATANAIAQTLPKESKVPAPTHVLDDLLSSYILTDYHMGMLAWHREGGANWSTEIAEQVLYDWALRAVSLVPRSKRAILAQLGDLLHHDSLSSVTPTNLHVLDADSRYPKIVEVTVRAARRSQ
jgi:hypothetical protein